MDLQRLMRFVTIAAAAATAALSGPTVLAHASEVEGEAANHAVFVQTNDPNGNAIVAYHRHSDGTLTWTATYPTGGNGGRAAGAGSDPLASQGSLVYDRERALLFAVNAGSDSVSVFSVDGDRLHLTQVIPSGGPFPNSVAVHDDLVYVLNAGLSGSVQGFRIDDRKVHPIAGSSRSLGLSGTINPPNFLLAPAQIGFTIEGDQLIIATKLNATVDVFSVRENGRLSSQPTINSVSGVPFAFVFDPAGRLVLVNAATGTTATYNVNGDGTLTVVSTGASSGQVAACWITRARDAYFIGNTGSGTLSAYSISGAGTVQLTSATATTSIPGAIDMAASNGGRFLYVESGSSGTVFEFAVGASGALAPLAAQPVISVPDGGSLEGIVAA